MDKIVFSFLLLVLFLPLSFAQTNNPIVLERCSYDARGTIRRSMTFLPYDYFPWGVCVDFFSYRLSSPEWGWMTEAMQIWDTQYNNYVYNRWGTLDMMYIPRGPLFIWSCDKDKYNIIYVNKDSPKPGERWIAKYTPKDKPLDFKDFHGYITMSKNKSWTRKWFINVFVHELGHALGLPHAPIDQDWTAIMRPYGFYCDPDDKKGDKKICKLNNYDFEKFLFPYNPERAVRNVRGSSLDFLNCGGMGSQYQCP